MNKVDVDYEVTGYGGLGGSDRKPVLYDPNEDTAYYGPFDASHASLIKNMRKEWSDQLDKNDALGDVPDRAGWNWDNLPNFEHVGYGIYYPDDDSHHWYHGPKPDEIEDPMHDRWFAQGSPTEQWPTDSLDTTGAVHEIDTTQNQTHPWRWEDNRRPMFYNNGNIYMGNPGDHHKELAAAVRTQNPELDLMDGTYGIYAPQGFENYPMPNSPPGVYWFEDVDIPQQERAGLDLPSYAYDSSIDKPGEHWRNMDEPRPTPSEQVDQAYLMNLHDKAHQGSVEYVEAPYDVMATSGVAAFIYVDVAEGELYLTNGHHPDIARYLGISVVRTLHEDGMLTAGYMDAQGTINFSSGNISLQENPELEIRAERYIRDHWDEAKPIVDGLLVTAASYDSDMNAWIYDPSNKMLYTGYNHGSMGKEYGLFSNGEPWNKYVYGWFNAGFDLQPQVAPESVGNSHETEALDEAKRHQENLNNPRTYVPNNDVQPTDEISKDQDEFSNNAHVIRGKLSIYNPEVITEIKHEHRDEEDLWDRGIYVYDPNTNKLVVNPYVSYYSGTTEAYYPYHAKLIKKHFTPDETKPGDRDYGEMIAGMWYPSYSGEEHDHQIVYPNDYSDYQVPSGVLEAVTNNVDKAIYEHNAPRLFDVNQYNAKTSAVKQVTIPSQSVHPLGDIPFMYDRDTETLYTLAGPGFHSDIYRYIYDELDQDSSMNHEQWISGEHTPAEKGYPSLTAIWYPAKDIPNELINYLKEIYPNDKIESDYAGGRTTLVPEPIADQVVQSRLISFNDNFISNITLNGEFVRLSPDSEPYDAINGHYYINNASLEPRLNAYRNAGDSWIYYGGKTFIGKAGQHHGPIMVDMIKSGDIPLDLVAGVSDTEMPIAAGWQNASDPRFTMFQNNTDEPDDVVLEKVEAAYGPRWWERDSSLPASWPRSMNGWAWVYNNGQVYAGNWHGSIMAGNNLKESESTLGLMTPKGTIQVYHPINSVGVDEQEIKQAVRDYFSRMKTAAPEITLRPMQQGDESPPYNNKLTNEQGLAAYAGDQQVGHITYTVQKAGEQLFDSFDSGNQDTTYVHWLYVDPEWRQQGLSKVLLDAVRYETGNPLRGNVTSEHVRGVEDTNSKTAEVVTPEAYGASKWSELAPWDAEYAAEKRYIVTKDGELHTSSIFGYNHNQLMKDNLLTSKDVVDAGYIMPNGELYSFLDHSESTAPYIQSVSGWQIKDSDVKKKRMDERWDEHHQAYPFAWVDGDVWVGNPMQTHGNISRENPAMWKAIVEKQRIMSLIKDMGAAPVDNTMWLGRAFPDGEMVDWRDRPVPDHIANAVRNNIPGAQMKLFSSDWKSKYNYRDATGKESCSTCSAFKHGNCEMFDAKVDADYTCDAWSDTWTKDSALSELNDYGQSQFFSFIYEANGSLVTGNTHGEIMRAHPELREAIGDMTAGTCSLKDGHWVADFFSGSFGSVGKSLIPAALKALENKVGERVTEWGGSTSLEPMDAWSRVASGEGIVERLMNHNTNPLMPYRYILMKDGNEYNDAGDGDIISHAELAKKYKLFDMDDIADIGVYSSQGDRHSLLDQMYGDQTTNDFYRGELDHLRNTTGAVITLQVDNTHGGGRPWIAMPDGEIYLGNNEGYHNSLWKAIRAHKGLEEWDARQDMMAGRLQSNGVVDIYYDNAGGAEQARVVAELEGTQKAIWPTPNEDMSNGQYGQHDASANTPVDVPDGRWVINSTISSNHEALDLTTSTPLSIGQTSRPPYPSVPGTLTTLTSINRMNAVLRSASLLNSIHPSIGNKRQDPHPGSIRYPLKWKGREYISALDGILRVAGNEFGSTATGWNFSTGTEALPNSQDSNHESPHLQAKGSVSSYSRKPFSAAEISSDFSDTASDYIAGEYLRGGNIDFYATYIPQDLADATKQLFPDGRIAPQQGINAKVSRRDGENAFIYRDHKLYWGGNHKELIRDTLIPEWGENWDQGVPVDLGWISGTEPYAESYNNYQHENSDPQYKQEMLDEAKRTMRISKVVYWGKKISAIGDPQVMDISGDAQDVIFIYDPYKDYLVMGPISLYHHQLAKKTGIDQETPELVYGWTKNQKVPEHIADELPPEITALLDARRPTAKVAEAEEPRYYRWSYHPSTGLETWPHDQAYHRDYAIRHGFQSENDFAGGMYEPGANSASEYHTPTEEMRQEGYAELEKLHGGPLAQDNFPIDSIREMYSGQQVTPEAPLVVNPGNPAPVEEPQKKRWWRGSAIKVQFMDVEESEEMHDAWAFFVPTQTLYYGPNGHHGDLMHLIKEDNLFGWDDDPENMESPSVEENWMIGDVQGERKGSDAFGNPVEIHPVVDHYYGICSESLGRELDQICESTWIRIHDAEVQWMIGQSGGSIHEGAVYGEPRPGTGHSQPVVYHNGDIYWGNNSDQMTHPWIIRVNKLDRDDPMAFGWVDHYEKQAEMRSWEERADHDLYPEFQRQLEELLPGYDIRNPYGSRRPAKVASVNEVVVPNNNKRTFGDEPFVYLKENNTVYVLDGTGNHSQIYKYLRSLGTDIWEGFSMPIFGERVYLQNADMNESSPQSRVDIFNYEQQEIPPDLLEWIQQKWGETPNIITSKVADVRPFHANMNDCIFVYNPEIGQVFTDKLDSQHAALCRKARIRYDDPWNVMGWVVNGEIATHDWSHVDLPEDVQKVILSGQSDVNTKLVDFRDTQRSAAMGLEVHGDIMPSYSSQAFIYQDDNIWFGETPYDTHPQMISRLRREWGMNSEEPFLAGWMVFTDGNSEFGGGPLKKGIYMYSWEEPIDEGLEPEIAGWLEQKTGLPIYYDMYGNEDEEPEEHTDPNAPGYDLDVYNEQKTATEFLPQHKKNIGSSFFCFIYVGDPVDKLYMDGKSYHTYLIEDYPELRDYIEEGIPTLFGQVNLDSRGNEIDYFSDWVSELDDEEQSDKSHYYNQQLESKARAAIQQWLEQNDYEVKLSSEFPIPDKVFQEAIYKHQCPMCYGYLQDRGGIYTCTQCPFEYDAVNNTQVGLGPKSASVEEITVPASNSHDRGDIPFVHFRSTNRIYALDGSGNHSEIMRQLQPEDRAIIDKGGMPSFGEYIPWEMHHPTPQIHFRTMWKNDSVHPDLLEWAQNKWPDAEMLKNVVGEGIHKITMNVVEIPAVEAWDSNDRTKRKPFVYSEQLDTLWIGPYGAHHGEVIFAALKSEEWGTGDPEADAREDLAMNLEDDPGNLGIIIDDRREIVYWDEPLDQVRDTLMSLYPGYTEEVWESGGGYVLTPRQSAWEEAKDRWDVPARWHGKPFVIYKDQLFQGVNGDEWTEDHPGDLTHARIWKNQIKPLYPKLKFYEDDPELHMGVMFPNSKYELYAGDPYHVNDVLNKNAKTADVRPEDGTLDWKGSWFYFPKTDEFFSSGGGHGSVAFDNKLDKRLNWGNEQQEPYVAGWFTPQGINGWGSDWTGKQDQELYEKYKAKILEKANALEGGYPNNDDSDEDGTDTWNRYFPQSSNRLADFTKNRIIVVPTEGKTADREHTTQSVLVNPQDGTVYISELPGSHAELLKSMYQMKIPVQYDWPAAWVFDGDKELGPNIGPLTWSNFMGALSAQEKMDIGQAIIPYIYKDYRTATNLQEVHGEPWGNMGTRKPLVYHVPTDTVYIGSEGMHHGDIFKQLGKDIEHAGDLETQRDQDDWGVGIQVDENDPSYNPQVWGVQWWPYYGVDPPDSVKNTVNQYFLDHN